MKKLTAIIALCIAVTACHSSTGSGNAIKGKVNLRDERLAAVLPADRPRMIYVTDFELPPQAFSQDQGVRGALPNVGQGVLGRIGQRLPAPLANGDSAQKAADVVTSMSRRIVSALRTKGLPAEHFDKLRGGLPSQGWLVQGGFVEVSEGNRLRRSAVGFGRGASRMELNVAVTDLSSGTLRPFLVFGTEKEAGRMPGGAAVSLVTKTPYGAAARFVMEKNATRRDVEKTAEQVAEEIARYAEAAGGHGR